MSHIQITGCQIEELPPRRLIGKRYTDQDRDQTGSFAPKWKLWLQNRCCEPLYPLTMPGVGGDILGFMRCVDGNFEYWIGRNCLPDAIAPAGYDYLDLSAAKVAVIFLRGEPNDPSIFEMHDESLKYLAQKGFTLPKPPFFAERYVTNRFCHPDAGGMVTLDYLVSVQ